MAKITGGGIQGSKVVQSRSGVKVEPTANRANVEGVAQQGMATAFTKKPVIQGKGYEPSSMGPTGVPGYFNSAKVGPGSGRTIMKSGSQSEYGKAVPAPASQNRPLDILSQFAPERFEKDRRG